jgi:DNA topoisomerase-2
MAVGWQIFFIAFLVGLLCKHCCIVLTLASIMPRAASVNDENAPPVKAKGGKKKKTVSETYVKMTQHQHILARPDSYVGSIQQETDNIWVWNSDQEKMEERNVTFVPGLFKIFDEILVNAADNKQRDANMSALKVTIDREEGSVTVFNDGKTIPIKHHDVENMYVPELIFGHLLTSSNYDDSEQKTTGGRNGYGAKLANIFSTEFIVVCCDGQKKYTQKWTDNMTKAGKPKITSLSSKKSSYTEVTFKPDFAKFNMPGLCLDDDIVALFSKRVYDIAGTSHKNLKVYLNGERIKVNTFDKYG